MDDMVPYSIPESIVDVDTDFIGSNDLKVLEEGIRAIGRAADVLALAQGVAIVKVEAEGMWIQASFPNLRAYRIAQAERLEMPAATISLRRRTAEAWLMYREQLGPLQLAGKVSSLAFFNEGVQRHGLKKTLAAFKKMTVRDFQAWAAPRDLLGLPLLLGVEMSIRGRDIVIEGSTVASFAEEVEKTERDYLAGLIRDAYSSRKAGMVAHVVSVKDESEAKAVDGFVRKLRGSPAGDSNP